MPPEKRVTRKLRAILSADVKGYSILMADDEIFTIKTIKEYRGIMSRCIEQHNGRVVDSPGDNVLSEFASVVDAVQCAVEIQKQLKKENERLVEDKRLEFRIGVNIGDVVQDEDRIYGDGVNIASRIEGLADPAGICVSRSAYDQIKKKLGFGFEYMGEHPVKNISEPVRVYKVLIDSDSSAPLVDEPLELPDKPSIAILPFNNMSGDPSQEYFSDGLTEQIINGLCKVSNLFVIGRNSSFAYKGKSISTKQIAQELGVRYILEGSVQKAGERVRITAQLIDVTTDYHMWSESYDRDLSDIFALQDEITLKLVTAMGINLTLGEQARLFMEDIRNIQVFDKIYRGLECLHRYNKQDNSQARQFFKQASNLDETSALAFACIGWVHYLDLMFNWSENPLESFVEAENNVLKSLALNKSLDPPHTLMAWIHLYKKEYDKAIYEAKKAVDLNPNGAHAVLNFGYIICLAGEPEKGLIFIKKAKRLNPVPHITCYVFLGDAYRLTGQYEKAIEILNRCILIEPEALQPYLFLTSCYIDLNEVEKAQKTAKKVLEIDPSFSFEYHKSIFPHKDQTVLEKYIESLRKAGLPE